MSAGSQTSKSALAETGAPSLCRGKLKNVHARYCTDTSKSKTTAELSSNSTKCQLFVIHAYIRQVSGTCALRRVACAHKLLRARSATGRFITCSSCFSSRTKASTSAAAPFCEGAVASMLADSTRVRLPLSSALSLRPERACTSTLTVRALTWEMQSAWKPGHSTALDRSMKGACVHGAECWGSNAACMLSNAGAHRHERLLARQAVVHLARDLGPLDRQMTRSRRERTHRRRMDASVFEMGKVGS
eukprot:6196692-Pleurochrysis_carterae.AAC.3